MITLVFLVITMGKGEPDYNLGTLSFDTLKQCQIVGENLAELKRHQDKAQGKTQNKIIYKCVTPEENWRTL